MLELCRLLHRLIVPPLYLCPRLLCPVAPEVLVFVGVAVNASSSKRLPVWFEAAETGWAAVSPWNTRPWSGPTQPVPVLLAGAKATAGNNSSRPVPGVGRYWGCAALHTFKGTNSAFIFQAALLVSLNVSDDVFHHPALWNRICTATQASWIHRETNLKTTVCS